MVVNYCLLLLPNRPKQMLQLHFGSIGLALFESQRSGPAWIWAVINPFNVEGPGQSGPGSWQTFHVSLAENADIAADTLRHKLSVSPQPGKMQLRRWKGGTFQILAW